MNYIVELLTVLVWLSNSPKKEIERGLQNKVKGYDFGPYYLSNGAETLNTYLHNIDEKDAVRLPDCALGFVVRCHSKNEGIKVF